MCLSISKELTEAAKQLDPESWVQRYKTIKVSSNTIQSLFFPHIWKIGVNVADLNEPVIKDYIEHGIHVYIGLFLAASSLRLAPLSLQPNEPLCSFKIMKVHCQLKDLIAVSFGLEVYTQVTLKEEDYNVLICK